MPATTTARKSNNSNTNVAAPTNNNTNNNLLHPCLAIYKNGCKFGNKCKFANVPRTHCVEFLRTGTCSKGNSCRFSIHQAFNMNKKPVINNYNMTSGDTNLFPSLLGDTAAAAPSNNNNNSSASTTTNNKITITREEINNNNDDDDDCCETSSNNNTTNHSVPVCSRGTDAQEDELFPSNNDLSKVGSAASLPPGFAYKLHTLTLRANNYSKPYLDAKKEIESIKARIADLEEQNAKLKETCDENELTMRVRLEMEYRDRFAAEAKRKVLLTEKMRTADSFSKFEIDQGRKFCNGVKKLVDDVSASILREASSCDNSVDDDSKNKEAVDSIVAKLASISDGIHTNREKFRSEIDRVRNDRRKHNNKKAAAGGMNNRFAEEEQDNKNQNDDDEQQH